MPKARTKFPYWDLAQELHADEGISMPEAIQRVVESAIEDAVDRVGGRREKGFWGIRSKAIALKDLRKQYREHHPRAVDLAEVAEPAEEQEPAEKAQLQDKPQITEKPQPLSKVPEPNPAETINEQIENLNRFFGREVKNDDR